MGGFFGTIQHRDCVSDLFYGIDYHFHMGTRRGGMITLNADNHFHRAIHNIENSYFRTKFEPELLGFSGSSGIGVVSDTDPQPITMNCHLGRFAIVTVAKIVNMEELVQDFLNKGNHFSEQNSGVFNQTELVALLINEGKTFVEGIENVYRKVKGSCSMLILTENGLIAARDKLGRTPIILAQKEDGYALASESCSFPNLGFEIVRDLGPGEIVQVTADGYEQLRKPNDKMQICSFLWVYYGYPVCSYEGRNVEEVRYSCGCEMGRKDDVEADMVSPIPDSGIGMAMGYAVGKGVPYRGVIAKYTPTWPRSFMPSDQKRRDLVAKMKLIANRSLIKGSRVVFCDDSIVRGTQLRDNVSVLYGYGAKEVHMRIACPPLIFPCTYINFSASKSSKELITRRVIERLEGDENRNLQAYATTGSPQYNKMVGIIRNELKITTLKYNPLETLVKAIGLPKSQICTHCFDGSSYY
ncbi:MAG: amidophosphoribosyltransferase [Bacteroidales bacterium]|nr:amidophosphoribosyltransferase [Bacteroidales bacterium]